MKLRLPGWARWLVLPALAGALAGASIDIERLPFASSERIDAVLLLDGQAYFGHLEDFGLSDTVTLRDVYYFQDARATTTNLAVALVQRGTELHAPADGMPIRRATIMARAVGDRKAVRHAALADLAIASGLRGPDATAYVAATEPRLDDASAFANEPGALLAPGFFAIVSRADTLLAQVADQATRELTTAPAAPSPSPSARP